MIEILFRGKRKGNGEWVHGYYNKFASWLNEREIHSIIEHPATLYPYADVGETVEVDLYTVGQYTGLTDINGTKVYEGDVLESPIRGFGKPHGIRILISDIRKCNSIALYANDYFVCGNIHDNPELIEV